MSMQLEGSQGSCTRKAEGPTFDVMLCCCCLEILNNSGTGSPMLSFCMASPAWCNMCLQTWGLIITFESRITHLIQYPYFRNEEAEAQTVCMTGTGSHSAACRMKAGDGEVKLRSLRWREDNDATLHSLRPCLPPPHAPGRQHKERRETDSLEGAEKEGV